MSFEFQTGEVIAMAFSWTPLHGAVINILFVYAEIRMSDLMRIYLERIKGTLRTFAQYAYLYENQATLVFIPCFIPCLEASWFGLDYMVYIIWAILYKSVVLRDIIEEERIMPAFSLPNMFKHPLTFWG